MLQLYVWPGLRPVGTTVTVMFWFVVNEPDGESCTYEQPLLAVQFVAVWAVTPNVCWFPVVLLNDSDDALSVRDPAPPPPPPVPPLTAATTGTVMPPLAVPLPVIAIEAVFIPLPSVEGFRCTVNV